MNIVEKVNFVSTLAELKIKGKTFTDVTLKDGTYKKSINDIVEYFDPPATKKLEKLQTDVSTLTSTSLIANLPNYLQECLELYENDFAYDSERRNSIADTIARIGSMLNKLQSKQPNKQYLLFFTDALAIDHPASVKQMLDLIEQTIFRLTEPPSPKLNDFILSILDPLGDCFEVTSSIRTNHEVHEKYITLLTDLCRRYASRQKDEMRLELRAPAMPKPVLEKTYHVFRSAKRVSGHGTLHWRFKLSYGLQACRRIESDESGTHRLRRRIWDVVSVVSGSSVGASGVKLPADKIAEAIHTKVREAKWYDKIERAEKDFRNELVDNLTGDSNKNFQSRLVGLSSYHPYAADWQYAYGLGSHMVRAVNDALKVKLSENRTASFVNNLGLCGDWMAFGFPLGTTFDNNLRSSLKERLGKELGSGGAALKTMFRPPDEKDVATQAKEFFGKRLKNLRTDEIGYRHWKNVYSVLYSQAQFLLEIANLLESQPKGRTKNDVKPPPIKLSAAQQLSLQPMLRLVRIGMQDYLWGHWKDRMQRLERERPKGHGKEVVDDYKFYREKFHYDQMETQIATVVNKLKIVGVGN